MTTRITNIQQYETIFLNNHKMYQNKKGCNFGSFNYTMYYNKIKYS